MALNVANAQQGSPLPIAYGRVRATGSQIINQTDVAQQWQPSHSYSANDFITDGTNGQICIVGGFSGGSAPSWNTIPGGNTSDNGVTWQNQGSSNGDGTMYGFWVLGEGEWDGFDTLWNQNSPLFAIGYQYDISSGSYAAWGPNPPSIHFHSGTDGALGAGLPSPSSNGPDQGCDNWIGELPSGAAILAQTYSRMAYYALKWLPEFVTTPGGGQVNQVGQPLSPIGDWRALRCRIFDATGAQIGYQWTTNPAWHWVDLWIRCALMPRSEYTLSMSSGPPYTTTPEALPSDVTDKFDWGSIWEFSQDCDYVLANGRKRFEGNYAFASQTPLAAMLEQVLTNSRGYQQEYAGRLYLNMDKPRPSVFLLTSAHQVPLSFTVDDKEVHQNANDYTSAFLDMLVPAIGEISSIDFVYPGSPPYTSGQATVVTVNVNPVAPWDVFEVGGNSNSLLNRFWMVNNIIDDYTFTCQPLAYMTSSQSGTGGFFGYPQARFSKRTPELWHEQHAIARGQIGPNNPSVQRSKRIPLTLDFASTTYDQQSRLTMYELYRSCGLDPSDPFLQSLYSWLAGSPWVPPVTVTVKVWSEAVDVNWNVLKQVMRGQRITIDPTVSTEWAGDYEVMETTYNPFQGDASQFSTEGGGDPSTVVGSSVLASPADQNSGTLLLVLRTYNPNVFFDTSRTPSYVNLPGPILGDPEA